ncbi:S-adenosyl-L-methionine-dependent methyltransferase [Terfezia claveryi]|nr:S-adenosyl-L-methionine-dependent methyltransferase [Terfezia claveryi]
MKPRISTAQVRNCSRLVRGVLWPTVRAPSGQMVRFNSSSTTPVPNTTPNVGSAKPAAASGKTASVPPALPSLEKQLVDIIKMNGPIPLALYMKQCLTSATHGYYTTPRPNFNPSSSSSTSTPPDPFGATGDFITSPEISQMFGEMLGLWILTEWLGQGRRKEGVVLMELGPGRGTLMADVLRTLGAFPEMRSAVEKVVLLEASGGLRETQAKVLCGDGGLKRTEDGNGWCGSVRAELGGGKVEWYEDWELVPKDTSKSPYILAQEFFDALPIHAFQATRSGWRELLVTHRSLSTPPPSATTVITPTSTSKSPTSTPQDPFHLILSPTPTPYSQLLPNLSPRHAPLLNLPTTTTSPTSLPATIEISPLSLTLMSSLSRMLSSSPSGALLIIDYGPSSHTPSNSLRGIRNHNLVSPFSNPGDVDLSAEVDFLALAETAVGASEGVEVHGPVEQGGFLEEMGMRERMEVLVRAAVGEGEGEGEGRRIREAFDRLVGRERGGMGRVYKALAVVKERGGGRPVGFGGVVVGG